ncbi:unnamed protein product [Musa textilis]
MASLRGRRDRMWRRMMSGSSVNRSSAPCWPAADDVDEDEEGEREADADGGGGRGIGRQPTGRLLPLLHDLSLSLSLSFSPPFGLRVRTGDGSRAAASTHQLI